MTLSLHEDNSYLPDIGAHNSAHKNLIKGGGLVQYEVKFQGWQRRSSGKFTICYVVFLRKRRRWEFFKHASGLQIFRFNFPTKRL